MNESMSKDNRMVKISQQKFENIRKNRFYSFPPGIVIGKANNWEYDVI